MATTVQTFTNASGTLQPFISSGGGKFIDNFSSADLVAGNTDPYQGIAFYKIESVQMTAGGTGTGTMGLWKSAGVRFETISQSINGVAATVSSTVATELATINAVIAGGTTYYAGLHAATSLASRRDSNTGSFSSYSGSSNVSTTVSTTYNPGNLNFILKYYYLPNAPAAPTITSKTSTSVTIGWSAPSDPGGYAATTLRYKIKYTSASGVTAYPVYESAANASSATISGLIPGETYQFYVAAMNGVIPSGGVVYTSIDGSVQIDYSSSGPYSPASTAVQLPGGYYNGLAWKPIGKAKRMTVATTAFTSGNVATLSVTGTITLALASLPVSVGDTVVISGTTGLSGYNGVWMVSGTGGSSGSYTVNFSQGYFNSSPTTVANVTTQGTAAFYKTALIKYNANGTAWQDFY